MAPPTLPTELILDIFKRNLNPRDHRTRMASLTTYCLLNKSFNEIYQRGFIAHIQIKGNRERVWATLIKVQVILLVDWAAPKQVRTVVCDLKDVQEREREGVSNFLMNILAPCTCIEEMAFGNVKELNLAELVEGWVKSGLKPSLRVLHLSQCVSKEMHQTPVAAWGALQYLAIDLSSIFPISGLPNLVSQAYSSLSYTSNSTLFLECAAVKVLRATQTQLGFGLYRKTEWISGIECLELIQNKSLKGYESVIAQFHRLHTITSSRDLRYLNTLILGGHSPLKVLRLARTQDDENKPDTNQDWFIQKDALEETCRKHNIQLDFDFREDGGAVRFWEECTGEEFILQGFR